jgi:hypothetical protein
MINEDFVHQLWDAIIVGGGAAGAAAALGLRGKRVLMLDVGIFPPPNPLPDQPLYQLRQNGHDLFDTLVGRDCESMTPIAGDDLSPKLKAPLIRFITERPKCLPTDVGEGFQAVQSFSLGGLANAWGAGCFRYNEQDLSGFPISADDLSSYYDELTDHVGINGCDNDDLTNYFGSTYGLQPTFELSPLIANFLSRYHSKRTSLVQDGFRVGRPRMAILSRPHRGRRPYRAFGQDFMWGPQEGIYSPLFTIKDLIASNELRYQSNVLATDYQESSDFVSVTVKDLESHTSHSFRAARLILAAGALNSARLVLAANNDTSTRLPLLDNPVSFIPAVDLSRIGTPLQTHAYIGAELVVLAPGDRPERPVQGSVYGLMGPLRTDLIREFPLSIRGNLTACKFLVPGMVMVQMFYPDEQISSSWLKRNYDGGLTLHREGRPAPNQDREICSSLRKMGYLAFTQLCVRPVGGSSIHYAGTLTMDVAPKTPYHTAPSGRLESTHRVYVADAATFPSLPSKNHTFTLMANALRIAKGVRATLP